MKHWALVTTVGTTATLAFALGWYFGDQATNVGEGKRSHLTTPEIYLPAKYEFDSKNGMAVKIKDRQEGGTDVLLLFYGDKHYTGAVRLRRILMQFPRGKDVFSLSDCKAIHYDGPTANTKSLDCLKGYLVLDRDSKKIEIDFVVLRDKSWHRFAWNGVWKYENDPDLDVPGILENMGITAPQKPKGK